MLQHFGVIPFLIFDGDYLPSKAATETDREKRREGSRRAGLELLNAGKAAQAHSELQKAVDVSPAMARQLIDELKKAGVQYIVAPYEADAQMVYLERKGIIDGILSEDSDLLVFGAKCLLTKLDQYGNCIEINKADFCACKEINLTGWTDTEFRHMAILSGCDYLASMNNMGLKTAYRMVRRHKTIEQVLRMLSFDGKFRVPKGYLQDFYRAELTFLHQRVFCPKTLRLVFHTEPAAPIDEEQMPFIGAYVDPEIAQGVARGDLNPMTKLPIVADRSDNMGPPTTPWTVSKAQPSRLSSVTPNQGKPGTRGNPIDTFFKPKRTPLAELDINCFTPSPSQHDALRRNSGPWVAAPAPRPYLNSAIVAPQPAPQSAPPSAQNTRRAHLRTPTISEPRPPKRARLCEEVEIDSPMLGQSAELGRSRFFNQISAKQSPTFSKKLRDRRTKKEDITIFSDDSIEEALLSLPDFDGFTPGPKSGSKVSVFKESIEGIVDTQECAPSIQIPTITAELPASSFRAPALTPSVSTTSSEGQASTPIDAVSLHSGANKFLDRFSYTPIHTPTQKSIISVHGQPTPASSDSLKKSRIPLAVKSKVPAPSVLVSSRKHSITPLERLGATAVNRLKLPMTPPLTPTLVLKANPVRRSTLPKAEISFPEVAKEDIVEPDLVPLPLVDEAENMALSAQNGSEDMIVPDSESEGEDLCTGAGDEGPRMKLERFTYAAIA